MGYRYYDWECCACGTVAAQLTWVDFGSAPPKVDMLPCAGNPCSPGRSLHRRRVSLPAAYMGEKQWHPMVAGGSFDTVGQKATRRLPLPSADIDARGLRDHFRSPQWRDAKAERAEQRKHNALKRRRTALAKQGQSFNLRRSEDRLPGDPKI